MTSTLTIRFLFVLVALSKIISFHRFITFTKPFNFLSQNTPKFAKIEITKKYRENTLYSSNGQIISDKTYEEWLDDIIYSGDINGYIRRHGNDLVTDDFCGYLEERIETCQDNDEKKVIEDIVLVIHNQLNRSDGLEDSELIYEKRLDRILFNSPQKRREYIKNISDDLTVGFIHYIKTEITSSSDSDVKVVLASILQMIGQLKNMDLLDNMDNTKDLTKFNELMNNSPSLAEGEIVPDNNEMILASLVFSQNDVLEDVLNNVSNYLVLFVNL